MDNCLNIYIYQINNTSEAYQELENKKLDDIEMIGEGKVILMYHSEIS